MGEAAHPVHTCCTTKVLLGICPCSLFARDKPSCPDQHVCSETELFCPSLLAQKTMESQSHQETTDQIINMQVNVCLLKDERASQTYVLVP